MLSIASCRILFFRARSMTRTLARMRAKTGLWSDVRISARLYRIRSALDRHWSLKQISAHYHRGRGCGLKDVSIMLVPGINHTHQSKKGPASSRLCRTLFEKESVWKIRAIPRSRIVGAKIVLVYRRKGHRAFRVAWEDGLSRVEPRGGELRQDVQDISSREG